jgi:hypothetical protein
MSASGTTGHGAMFAPSPLSEVERKSDLWGFRLFAPQLVELQPERFDHRRPECNVGGVKPGRPASVTVGISGAAAANLLRCMSSFLADIVAKVILG